jgi:hypothetical protein
MSDLFAAWREVAHISEITGLSVGAIAALIAAAYLDPTIRKFAIRVIILLVIGYVSGIYLYHLGAKDKQAQWDEANAAADKKAAAHDAALGASIHATYMAQLAALQKQADENQQQVTEYERTLKSTPACLLGDEPLRLRHH